MRIAYVTIYDASNVDKRSGVGYHVAQSLRDQGEQVDYIGPLKAARYYRLFRMKRFMYNSFFGKNYLENREPLVICEYARQVARRLDELDADVVFSDGTLPIAYLECQQPIAFWADATFAGMVDFYPSFTNLCQESLEQGHRVEWSALSRSRLAIYRSEWATRSAIEHSPLTG